MAYGPRHQYPPGTLLAALRDLDLALLDLAAAITDSLPAWARRLLA